MNNVANSEHRRISDIYNDYEDNNSIHLRIYNFTIVICMRIRFKMHKVASMLSIRDYILNNAYILTSISWI